MRLSGQGRLRSRPGCAKGSETGLVNTLWQSWPIAAHIMCVYAQHVPKACHIQAVTLA